MSRNLLLLLLVALVALPLGASYFFGSKAEQVHQAFAKQFSAQGTATLKETEFSKGLLKSSARDVVEVCSAASGCRELVISSVIYHGPIAIAGLIDGVAPLRPLQAMMISRIKLDGLFAGTEIKPAVPEMMVTTLAELDGSTRATLDMPASTHTITGKPGKIALVLGGVTGEFTGTAGSDQQVGEVKLASMKLTDESGMTVSLNNVVAQVDGRVTDAGFIGTLREKVGSLTVATAADDPQPFVLKDLNITLKGSRTSDGLSQSQFTGGIKVITAAGRDYGPAQLEGEVLRFNRAALTRMQKQLEKLEAQKKPAEEMLPAMMDIYQKGIPEALGSRPEFNLKSLNLKTPDGEVVSSLKLVGVPPQGELNLGSWPTMLQAELSLQIPAVTLWNILDAQLQQEAHKVAAASGQPVVMPGQDAIAAKVDELVKNKVFVPKLDANAYRLEMALLEGRLLLNGQENQAFAGLVQAFGAQPAVASPNMEVAPPTP